MNLIGLVCSILVCFSLHMHCFFDSLPKITTYAKHADEYPEADNIDWEHPDFSSHYKSLKPSFGFQIKSFFGLGKNQFDLNALEQALQKVTAQRIERGLHGDFVQKIRFIEQGRLIVFGDVQGAFHSLVRSLNFLVSQDLLSEELILQEDTYMVFNGSVIGAAPYNLETLMTVLVLMQKNPERVVYISGRSERNKNKEEQELYRQLKLSSTDNDQADTVFSQAASFFDTLPRALYVARDPAGALKIFSEASVEFNDERLGSFLSSDTKESIIYANKSIDNPSDVSIESIVGPYDYTRTEGLKRYAGSPITWTVFSSPTGAHRRLYGFFKDAFVVIDSAVHFHDWLITLYANDLLGKSGFEAVATYNLSKGVFISGRPIDFFDNQEVQKFEEIIKEKKKLLADLKEACKKNNGSASQSSKTNAANLQKQLLLVGTSADLSKGAKNLGRRIKETLTKVFEEKNKKGGVRGVTFQNIFLDDQYTPAIARQNFLKLVNELNVDILLAPFGTATIQEAMDLLKDNKMILLFPAITESSPFRRRDLKNVASLSVSYYEQGKALINYLLQKTKPQKIALFYQNDDFGKDGLAGAKAELKKHNLTNIIELPYERNQVDFSSQVKLIEDELPDAIGFFSIPYAATEFMKALGARLLSGKTLFGISDLRDNDLLQFLNEKGLQLIYANSLPDWRNDSMQLAKEYKQFALANEINPDPFSFETYVIAQIFFYLIEQVKGPVTKEKIMQAVEKIKNLDFKGLKLNFDPGSRVLLDAVWIGQNNNEPWVKVPVKESGEQSVQKAELSAGVESPSVEKSNGGLLTLGTSLDLSKTLKKVSEVIKDTLTKIFEEKNKSGGVHGLQIRDIFLDDSYVPSIARQNYLNLLDMQVDIIFASRGTPTTQELLDFVKAGRMALLFPIGTESRIFRQPDLKNSINLTASYYEQGVALINTIFNGHKQPEKIAFFYQNDNFGKDLLEGAKSALSALKFTNIVEIPYERGQVDFSAQAEIIRNAKPNAIGLFGTALPAIELIKAIGPGLLANTSFFGSSVLREQDFLQFLTDKGLLITYASLLPDWRSDDLPIASNYREFVARNDMEPDPFGFEAYVVANLLLYLIEQVEGTVTKEKIIEVAEKIHDYDFQGLFLSFNPATRVLLNKIWISKNTRDPWIGIQLDVPKAQQEKPQHDPDEKIKVELEESALSKTESQTIKTEEVEAAEVKKEDEQPVIALHDNVLLLGNTSDSTKGLKPMTDAIRQGMELAIKEINDRGGVNDLLLKINSLDDEYTPILARKNIETLLNEYKTNLFIGTVGTATLDSYIDMVQDGKIAVFFPFSGSSTFRVASLKNIIHYTPSYNQTTGAATTYILKNFPSKKWALLYQDDIFGTVLKAAMRKLLKKNNITEILEVPYDRNDLNFKEQVKIVTDFNPDVIGFYGPSISAQGFIRVADVKFLSSKVLYGLSWLAGDKLQTFLKEKGLKMIIPCVLPDPKTSEIPLAKKFRKVAEQLGAVLDVNAFEGYLDVVLFAHLLKQVKGTITIEKLMQAAQEIKDTDFEGLNLNFDPNSRVLSHEIWLDLGNGEEWVNMQLEPEEIEPQEMAKPDNEIKVESAAPVASTVEPQVIKTETVAQPEEVKKRDEQPLQALHGDTLALGSTMDISKGLKSMSDALRQGMGLKLNEIKASGGINEIQLKVDFLDDEYIPEKAKGNVLQFLKEYDTNLFISSVGTPTLESYIDLVKEGKIALFFPFTGSSTFRKAELKNLLFYSPSYDETTGAATTYILKKSTPKRWALLYQNDTFGTVPKDAVKKLLEKNNVKDVLEVSFARNDVNFSQQAKDILAFKPEVIGFFGPAIAAQGFIQVAGVKDLADKILYGLSWLAGDKLQSFLQEKGLKMIIPCVVPDPKTSEAPIVKEFRQAAKDADIALDVNAFEGYINVALFAHILKQVEKPITVEKIMRVAENMKNVNFGGLQLNFDPNLRQLSHYTWLDLGTGEEWVKIDLAAEREK